MGCCESSHNITKPSFESLIKISIEENSLSVIKHTLNSKTVSQSKQDFLTILDSPIISIETLQLNAMGYCLLLGRYSIFELFNKFGCSMQKMDELFFSQQFSALDIICYKGYSDILNYYLPYYVENYPEGKQNEKKMTIEMREDEYFFKQAEKLTPVQTLVKYGHIQGINVVYDYFMGKSEIPYEFDLSYRDEYGENSSLIACRYGNYPMVKFLYKKCGCNFSALNKAKENAIQIATGGSRIHPGLEYYQIIDFLISVAGIDVAYNYEETLLLAESNEIISFIEEKLRERGIKAKKYELERQPCSDPERTPESEMYFNRSQSRFNLLAMYNEKLLEANDSIPSSIECGGESLGKFFGSSLSEFHK
ncbi:hypothetical protein SteCoe_22494 [Stentor coeruleus]|uniref:DUF3447 domain-containing protein n=1 Tax=Stentor coeruleus TaxID=5963 RepID=A0A1R2BM13_9CILI|nr:hypothetical protein SteCoe_22494 [Stentor coeruleus]